jgi:hypothetical protein
MDARHAQGCFSKIGSVRVIEGRVAAGGYEPKHRDLNNVMVSLADFDAEVRTYPNGEWTRMHCVFGTAMERGIGA